MLEFSCGCGYLSPTPSHLMKSLLLIPILSIALFASACHNFHPIRTLTPVDPNTMKPSDRCLPGNVQPAPSVHATK
jgi:hypothetical protein